MTVHQDLAVLVEDADVHRPGVPVDAAVKWVLSGVKSHEVSSFLVNRFSPDQHTTVVWGGASISVKAVERTGHTTGFFPGQVSVGCGRSPRAFGVR